MVLLSWEKLQNGTLSVWGTPSKEGLGPYRTIIEYSTIFEHVTCN